MVDLDFHPSLLALACIPYLGVEHAEYAALHGVGRYEQLVEAEGGEGTVDEVEDLSHFINDFGASSHHQIVGVYLGVTLMEVARTDAGYVAFLRLDIEQFRVNLQTLHTEDDVDAFLLHTFAPLDVALLVKSGEQFHYRRHLLAVASRRDESFHHLRVLGESIERSLDCLHLGLDGSLSQHTYVSIKTMVGHVYESIFLTYLVENALVGYKFRLHDRCPFLVFQVLVSTIRERHQVFVILISSACERSIEFFGVEALTQFLLHLAWHLMVVDDAHGFALLATVHTQGNLLHGAKVGIVVHLHLGVLGKLETVGTVGAFLETEEDKGQTVTDDVVEIHDVVEAVAGRYFHPSSVYAVGHFDDGIFLLIILLLAFLYDEIDAVVFQYGEVFYFREPDGVDRTIELVVEELRQEVLLLVVEAGFGNEANLVAFQFLENSIHRLSVFFRIRFIELIDGFERFLDLLFCFFVELMLQHAVE